MADSLLAKGGRTGPAGASAYDGAVNESEARGWRPRHGWDRVPPGLPLLIALGGPHDAGAVVRQFHVLALTGEEDEAGERPELVAAFDTDELHDYRARRPIVAIGDNRVQAVELPRLEITRHEDADGREFLLLAGAEPDFLWQRFTAEIVDIVERLGVGSVTWIHSLGMPVPHTRPVRLSVHGNRRDMVEQLSVWAPSAQVPGHVMHLLHYRLAALGVPVLGLVALVPHYVVETEVPGAILAVLQGIGVAAGLRWEDDGLREADRVFRQRIDEQVEGNEEVRRVVAALEEQHDSYLAGLPQQSSFASADGTLPSADDIAAELERFLRQSADRGDGQEPPRPFEDW